MHPLPEFTRKAWASAEAQAVWAPRVQAVASALLDMEVQSVREGVRPVALQLTPDVASLRRIGDLAYAPVTPGRCAIAQDRRTLDAFLSVWHGERDDVAAGRLLGFPECCCRFFHDVWNVRKLRDTTLAMAGADTAGPAACNILGRWLGVRLVTHLPCSWQCQRTLEQARALAPCWDPQALAWAEEMLSWPAEYSALHGIAIVVFPVVKVVVNTDYTASRQALRRPGTRYPDEAATGLQFPFERPQAAPLRLHRPPDARAWTDNGFQSREGMDAAHDMVLQALGEITPLGSVLDLGCGNGALLGKVRDRFGALCYGVEADTRRADRAVKAAGPGVQVVHGRIQDGAYPLETVDVALVSQRRFDEFTPEELVKVRIWLRHHARRVLTYSYDTPMFARLERTETCVA